MAKQKHTKKRKNIKRRERKMVKAIRRVEEKTPAELEVENKNSSLAVSTDSNVGDEYREYKKKLENVSQILSEIKELDNNGTRSH